MNSDKIDLRINGKRYCKSWRKKSEGDIKLSTLIDYVDSIGMGLETKIYPKLDNSKVKEEVLLRI